MFGVPSTLGAMSKTWTYKVKRANPNFEWHLDQLLTPKGVELFEKMTKNVKTLLSSRHISNLLDKLSDPKSISSEDFKEKSNCGKVWKDGRWVDLGNYAYNFMYDVLQRLARAHEKHHPAFSNALSELNHRWSSLKLGHACTFTAWIRKGDVLEFLLDDARCCDGSDAANKERKAYHDCVKQFGEDFTELLHLITENHDGPPEHDSFPPPHLLSKTCFVAYHVTRTKDGTCNKDWERLKTQIENFEDFVFEVGEGYDNASLRCPTTNSSEPSSPSDPSDAVSGPIPPPPARPPPDEL